MHETLSWICESFVRSCRDSVVFPAPEGDDGYYGFDVNTILHYAGNGKWSYEEDVYSPREAEQVVKNWIAAGGVIPS